MLFPVSLLVEKCVSLCNSAFCGGIIALSALFPVSLLGLFFLPFSLVGNTHHPCHCCSYSRSLAACSSQTGIFLIPETYEHPFENSENVAHPRVPLFTPVPKVHISHTEQCMYGPVLVQQGDQRAVTLPTNGRKGG